MHNTVDLWIFIMNLSQTSLRLNTLIAQIDVDLWIFENQHILTQKHKGSGRKMPWNCGVLNCNCISSAKGCGFVDFGKYGRSKKLQEPYEKHCGFVDFHYELILDFSQVKNFDFAN